MPTTSPRELISGPPEFPGFIGALVTMCPIESGSETSNDDFEEEFIRQALKLNNGKINQTALNANIPKKTLLRKIEKYAINPKDYYLK